MDIQTLRNFTTGRLHTDMAKVYEGLEYITGTSGIMTHQIPAIMRGVKPYLASHLSDAKYSRLWDGQFDLTHTGDIAVGVMTDQEFLDTFGFAR